MIKYTAIIIDDEEPAVTMIQWLLKTYCPNIEILCTASNALEGIQQIKVLSPQIVFLDIEMPAMNGFEMLNHFQGHFPFKVIFTTAYDHYAIQAIKFSAFDYLMKPIDKDELTSAISRLAEYQNVDAMQVKILNNIKTDTSQLAMNTLQGIEVIEIASILRCQSDSNYTHIYLANNTKKLYSKTLKALEELLAGQSFMRIHQSHLINLKFLNKYVKGDGGQVELKNGEIFPVARNKKQAMLTYLGMA